MARESHRLPEQAAERLRAIYAVAAEATRIYNNSLDLAVAAAGFDPALTWSYNLRTGELSRDVPDIKPAEDAA